VKFAGLIKNSMTIIKI